MFWAPISVALATGTVVSPVLKIDTHFVGPGVAGAGS